MPITARIIADSLSPRGWRLTSFLVTYHRFILAEIAMHRAISRSSASSRAIPTHQRITAVREQPELPVEWGAKSRMMQAGPPLPPTVVAQAEEIWRGLAQHAAAGAVLLDGLRVHKGIANRPLEPYAESTSLLSGTSWANLFGLRAHADAQPEFRELAYAMLDAYQASTPVRVPVGGWHLPFGDGIPFGTPAEVVRVVSAVRAARLSYTTHDGRFDLGEDQALFQRLVTSGHWGALEHAAQAQDDDGAYANYRGWKQLRHCFPNQVRGWADVRNRDGSVVRLAEGQRDDE